MKNASACPPDDAKMHLCQKLYWSNTVKIPNSPWVTIPPRAALSFSRADSLAGQLSAREGQQPPLPHAVQTGYDRRLERGKTYRKPPAVISPQESFATDNSGAIARP